jgi:hypothetical protein
MSVGDVYPDAGTVATFREREPGRVLLFRLSAGRYGTSGSADMVIVEKYLRGTFPFVSYFAKGVPAWLTFDSAHLEPLLSRLASDGILATVIDPRPSETKVRDSGKLRPELRAHADASWARNEAAYRYLGRRDVGDTRQPPEHVPGPPTEEPKP